MKGSNSLAASDNLKKTIQNGGLTFGACLLTVMILPVYVHYLPPLMILWGLFWLIENGSGISRVFDIKNKAAILFFLFIALFLWQLSSLIFTNSLNAGLERLFKRLSFLLFPLVLFYPGNKIIRNVELILRAFALCTFLYLLYCFGNALHNSLIITMDKWFFNPHPLEYDFENYFYGARLSYPIHPTYLSMYIVVSILIALEHLTHNSLSWFGKSFWLLIVSVFLIVLYLLSSRSGILAGVIILPLYFLYRYNKRLSKWFLIATILLLVLVFLKIATTNVKVQTSIDGIKNNNITEILKNDERLLIWKSALGVIKQNFLFGVGTGDASEEIKREFKSRGYTYGFYENMNAHNQFLEILLENGLIGLILFLTILIYMTYIALTQRNLMLGLFILMMIIFFMFETILNRLAGITFFPLFSFLLIHLRSQKSI